MKPMLRPLRFDPLGSTFLTEPNAKRTRFAQLTPWSLYAAPFFIAIPAI